MKAVITAILVLALAGAAGCGPKGSWEKNPPGQFPMGAPIELPVEREYRLAVGDEILLAVSFHEEFSTQAVVRPDGKITFPLVGEIMAAGFTPSELDSVVTRKFEEVVVQPDLSIIVVRYSDRLVYVLGEVQVPGAYELTRGMTVIQAITFARGPTTIGKMTDVVLIRRETPYEATGVKLDMEHFLEDGNYEEDAYLQAYDIVYVPRTKIGTMSVFMENFFRGWTYPLTLIVRGYDLMLINERIR